MTTTTSDRLFSFQEYLAYNDPDNRYELIDGKLELMNPPTFRHILICDLIRDTLKAEIERLQLPWLAIREGGIRTGWRKSRLADVYIVSREQVMESLDKSGVCESPPILVVEVVSPNSIKQDYRYKRSEYAALGINEYWIVDPLEKKFTLLTLEEGLYEESVFTDSQNIISPTFNELNLTVESVISNQ